MEGGGGDVGSDKAGERRCGASLGCPIAPGSVAVEGSIGAGSGVRERMVLAREEATARNARKCPPALLHFPPDSEEQRSGSIRSEREGELLLEGDMSAAEVDCSEESDVDTADSSLQLHNSLVNPMDFASELVFSETQSSEGVEEMASTSSVRRRTSNSLQEDETRRLDAVAEHNRKERIRRKELKEAVKNLRKQLSRPTKRPSTISVLRAAQDEIEKLKEDQENGTGRLESLKKRQSHLQWKLEELMGEVKKLPEGPARSCASLHKASSMPAGSRSCSFPVLPSPAPPAPFLMRCGLPQVPLPPPFLNLSSMAPLMTPPPSLTPSFLGMYPGGILPHPLFPPPSLPPHLPTHLPRSSPTSVGDSIRPHPLSLSSSSPSLSSVLPESYFMPPSFQVTPRIRPPVPLGIPTLIGQGSPFPSWFVAEKPYLQTPFGLLTEDRASQEPVFPVTVFSHPPTTTTTSSTTSKTTSAATNPSMQPFIASPTKKIGSPLKSSSPTSSIILDPTVISTSPSSEQEPDRYDEGVESHVHKQISHRAQTVQLPDDAPLCLATKESKLNVSEDDGEGGNGSAIKVTQRSASQSVPDEEEEDQSENYAWGRKKRRRKKRNREGCRSSSDSESEGSCSSIQGRIVEGKLRSSSSHTCSTSSGTANRRRKKEKSKSKKCTSFMVNRLSCIPPLLKVSDVEGHHLSPQSLASEKTTSIDLTSKCTISMCTNAGYVTEKKYVPVPPCPALGQLSTLDRSNSTNLTSSGSISSKKHMSPDDQVTNIRWMDDIVERSMNDLKQKFPELRSTYLGRNDSNNGFHISPTSVHPILLNMP